MTDRELSLIRRACDISREAFLTTSAHIKLGMREFDIAAMLRSNLLRGASANERCDGFAYCMSGPNSAQAYAAFQQTRSRTIEEGDFVLLHCNSYCGGFWTDITRTFSIGRPDAQNAGITEAVLEASQKPSARSGPESKLRLSMRLRARYSMPADTGRHSSTLQDMESDSRQSITMLFPGFIRCRTTSLSPEWSSILNRPSTSRAWEECASATWSRSRRPAPSCCPASKTSSRTLFSSDAKDYADFRRGQGHH